MQRQKGVFETAIITPVVCAKCWHTWNAWQTMRQYRTKFKMFMVYKVKKVKLEVVILNDVLLSSVSF